MELTREQMRIEHGRLWRWLAKNPKKHKMQWLGWKRIGHIAKSHCFACEVAWREYFEASGDIAAVCDLCPIKWTGKYCANDSAEYDKWEGARGKLKRRSALALKISRMWPKERP